MSFEQLLLIFGVTTFASTFSIIFGGGSFIIFPTLFLLGIDAKIAVATNLVGALAQVLTGSVFFNKRHKIHFNIVKIVIPFIVTGAIIGAFILVELESELIKKMVAGAIIVFATFSLFSRDRLLHTRDNISLTSKIAGSIASFFNGIYQMTISAGAGITSNLILVYFYGLKLKRAIATRQIISLTSVSIGSSILIYNGLIDWILFVPLASGRIIGAIIGSQIVMKTKSTVLSTVFSIIVIILALRILLNGVI